MTQIFTINTNTFISTSMHAWACKVKRSLIQCSDIIVAQAGLAGYTAGQLDLELLR